MTVVMINPNSTAAMTDAMVEAARACGTGLAIAGRTSVGGPPAIQGRADGDAATPPLLTLAEEVAAEGASGIIIGCFDDTALAEVRQRVACPVIGIGQAAYGYAVMRGWRFSVITTLGVSVPVLEDNIAAYGFGAALGRVRASEIPVLDLEADPEAATTRILSEARIAAEQDGVDAIVLGCAGMVKVTAALRSSQDLAVIDPVEAAIGCMHWLLAARG